MKWLRTWEGYSDNLIGDCEDILQDLRDEGVPFSIYLTYQKQTFETLLKAIMGFTKVDFRPSDWIDNLDQLNSFLQSRGWVYFDPRGVLSTWDEQKRVIMKGRVMDYMEIYFKK